MQSKKQVWTAAAVLAVVFVAGGLAWAFQVPEPGNRPGRGPGFSPDRAVGRMAQQLNLTDDQKSRVQSFLQDERTQFQALRNDTSLTREQTRQRVQEIQQQTRDKIRSILSVEQQMKADELRKQMQERMQARQQEMGDRFLNGLANRLDLTDSQKTTIKSYMQQQADQLKALRDNTSLSREQRIEQMRTIRRQAQEKVRAALTADQRQKLDDLRQRAQQRFQARRFGPRRGGRMRGF